MAENLENCDDIVVDDDLQESFNAAANHLAGLASSLPSNQLLHFYAYYKQATQGVCDVPKPGFFDLQGKQKWQAWKDLGMMEHDQAKREYIRAVKDLDPNVQFGGNKTDVSSWAKVSRLANREENEEGDEKGESLFDWVKNNRVDMVLKHNPSLSELDVRDEKGMGVIHWAADRGHTAMVECLLNLGLDVNMQDGEGQTSLHYAVACGHEIVVRLLLKKGADKLICDNDGIVPKDLAEDDNLKRMLL